jgi:hypothetical protein
MRLGRGWRIGVVALWLAGGGCTALREIPRAEYVERVADRPVRVVTRGGADYEFDSARIESDSLVGVRRREVGGPIDEFETVRLPLDEVAAISSRRIDWYRTGLVAGSAAAVIAATAIRSSSGGSGSAGGGKDPPPLP